jgi:hypothetical protein
MQATNETTHGINGTMQMIKERIERGSLPDAPFQIRTIRVNPRLNKSLKFAILNSKF